MQHLRYSFDIMDDLRNDGYRKWKIDDLTQFYEQLNTELQFQLHVSIVS